MITMYLYLYYHRTFVLWLTYCTNA